ncbi:MAG: hypothetical protein H6563_06505 [Lewinellaceae bacterium]|nr:hypothetical protein [Lewinellaceae bacterium]
MDAIESLYSHFLKSTGVSANIRKITPGCLFFALKSACCDDNIYARDALDRGAALAVVDDPALKEKEGMFWVEDTTRALYDLARHHRRQFHIPVVGIAGSKEGRLTTELLGGLMPAHYKTHLALGNRNYPIQVALSLLSMPPDVELVLVEMPGSQPDNIEMLCSIAEPSHGLVTRISGEDRHPAQLFRYLESNNGVAFLQKDASLLNELAKGVKRVIPFGQVEELTGVLGILEIQLLSDAPYLEVAFLNSRRETVRVRSRITGGEHFQDLAAVIALGKYFKVPSALIKTYLEENQVPST